MAESETEETLLEFPCRFPIKAMGKAESGLESAVAEILSRHAPGFEPEHMSTRPSRGGKWIAVTVVIEAHSKPQLDAIYGELTAHELVVWAL
ncbi:UPF0250 protein ybeD [Thiorhodococcus drewsii AZ1]|uniref:UPF0250 protein ThidrDRAFT_0184 n=1 Tax=Thiorhodococcus drewsii AZ1 TaxID=765913 RepID=G2DVL4_9GAMM|nr:DUF493 domain-containing protein [Thiorhodococcus drewsii]EGV34029.1 UPF0250 protein ybeD [Thiorhodococcus drewsii AZ1]